MSQPEPIDPDTPPVACTLDKLIDYVGQVLEDNIPEIQVTAAVTGHKPRPHQSFGQLVAYRPGTTDPQATIRATFRAGAIPEGVNLTGSQITATGRLSVSHRYGPLQFTVVSVVVDDEHSDAVRHTSELEAAITAEKLHLANKARELAEDAQRIALITPLGGGAGGADFTNRLDQCDYRWDITIIEVAMGATNAPAAIAAAIANNDTPNYDAIVVCRGGGAASDLAPFDSETVAKAIVTARLPVVVAVGHATDHHIADLVAHATLPTPSAAAAWFITRRGTAAQQALDIATRARATEAIATQQAATQAQAVADQTHAQATRREQQARAIIMAFIVTALVLVALFLFAR